MENFFKWLALLTPTEAVCYAILVCGVMLFIPFSDIFFKLIKKVVLMRRMSVHFFSYQFYPVEMLVSKDGKNVRQVFEKPNFVLDGGKVLLYWKVEGALSVSLYPRYGKVNGNMAEVMVSSNNREFQLRVKGLFSTKIVSLSIPEACIKQLETKELSAAHFLTNVPLVKSYAFTENVFSNEQFTLGRISSFGLSSTATGNVELSKIPLGFTRRLTYRFAEKLKSKKTNVQLRIESNLLTKVYSFSTKKYNQVNIFKS
jgi:hypothetical protein